MYMDVVDIIIEIPYHSNVKYELSKESNKLVVDRVLQTSMVYPANYGFIPNTLAADGDPLDALIIASYQLFPGCYIAACPIGVLYMEDEKGRDEKVICVPDAKVDRTYAGIKNVDDLPKHIIDEVMHFFEHYKDLEVGKFVKVAGVDGPDKAREVIASYTIR